MKILVAEDEPNIAESYKLLLEFKGHEVVLTHDGEECTQSYKQSLSPSSISNFDLVILDYRMPKKDGIQVAKEILSLVPAQRILLATAYVQDISISRLQEIPATRGVELIQKPFEFDTFLNLVSTHGANKKDNSEHDLTSLLSSNHSARTDADIQSSPPRTTQAMLGFENGDGLGGNALFRADYTFLENSAGGNVSREG